LGRPRKSAAQKRLEGTFRHCREPIAEPEYEIAVPRKPPTGLNKWARKFWNEYYPMLTGSGVLTEADIPTFVEMCKAWGASHQAEYDIMHNDDGSKRTLVEYRQQRHYSRNQMPEMLERREADDKFIKLAIYFGMTPSSRNKIDLGKKNDSVDPMEAMLTGADIKAVK